MHRPTNEFWSHAKTRSVLGIASNFVINPQILTFSVFKIANVSPYGLQIKFCMLLFFCPFTFTINLWHWKFVTADAQQCLLTIDAVYSATRTRFWWKHINTLSIHSYTRRGIEIDALQTQFVCMFFDICWISAKNEFLIFQNSATTCLRWGG